MIFIFIYAFTHIFVICKVNSGMLKISNKKPFRSQAKQIAANFLKDLVCKEEAKINALMHYLYRERVKKFTGISTRTLSHIKAEPGNEIATER